MKKSTRIIAVVLIGMAAMALFLEPTGVFRGRLMGETFFANRPASYWARQLSAGPAERSAARKQLEAGGPQAAEVVQVLLQSDSAAELRWEAAEILGALGPDAASAADVLVQALNDPDSHVQAVAAAAIPKVETPANIAVPALTNLLDTEHAIVAARALSEYRGQAKTAIPALVALLTDESKATEARWNAARTLGKIGPEAIDVVPVLIESMQDDEATIREHAAEAIGDVGPTAVAGIPALIDALDDPATRVRRDAVRSLGYIGKAAGEAVPEIKMLLEDPEEIVREAAINAIRVIAPEELPAPPQDAAGPASGP